MKAFLRSVRIAPKKANLVAGMVRNCTVEEALHSLKRTNKKAARIIERLIQSAVANAEHNEKQQSEHLVIESIVVNKAQAYHRGVPMARGRVRPIRKFMSHIEVTLGLPDGKKEDKESKKTQKTASKKSAKPAQSAKKEREKGAPSEAAKKAKLGTAASATRSATPKS
ncbi:MAG: 50S ribosomal protein L22 [Candidatus Peribacteraceae bacterium]|nr:50S ribosomal protein L22 [Candidatus Peribacteraceae bacterium]